MTTERPRDRMAAALRERMRAGELDHYDELIRLMRRRRLAARARVWALVAACLTLWAVAFLLGGR